MFKHIFYILAVVSFAFFGMVKQGQAQQKPQNSIRTEAIVVKVLENSEIIEDTGNRHPYQKLQLIGTVGYYKGKTLLVENGKYDQSGVLIYNTGDKIVLNVVRDLSGKETITITDYVRRTPLLFLLLIFVVLAVVVGGKRGFTSIMGMVVTFAILFLAVLPQVLRGVNPVMITILAATFIVPVTFSLAHGFNKKTLCAIAGTFISLFITGFLAAMFVNSAHLSGFASEEASYLNVAKSGLIDIQGLLLAGIIIGLLGILQDITISQAAIVFQLKEANDKLKFSSLFKRAMDVGRDHIASMSNTLILVYAGASLPLLLLFLTNPLPFSAVVNFEIIAEEIVRTLISSIGLILAVPITTALTALVVDSISKKKV